jgi:hypothetical protein
MNMNRVIIYLHLNDLFTDIDSHITVQLPWHDDNLHSIEQVHPYFSKLEK